MKNDLFSIHSQRNNITEIPSKAQPPRAQHFDISEGWMTKLNYATDDGH